MSSKFGTILTIVVFEFWSCQRGKYWRQGIFIIIRFFLRITQQRDIEAKLINDSNPGPLGQKSNALTIEQRVDSLMQLSKTEYIHRSCAWTAYADICKIISFRGSHNS